MNKLKIMDFTGTSYETDILISEIDYMIVHVITGDEVIEVALKNGTFRMLDSAEISENPRLYDFYDGHYLVSNNELENWSQRKDTYSYAWEGED